MADDWTIYHNPRCAKSRAALDLLSEHGVAPKIVLYVKEPLSVDELRGLARMLGAPIRALIRDIDQAQQFMTMDWDDDEAVLSALAQHPTWLQRPIVTRGGRGVIGRPAERVLELLREPPKNRD